MKSDRHWVGTWTTAPAPAEGAAFGGDTLRVRLSSAHEAGADVHPQRVVAENPDPSTTIPFLMTRSYD